MFAILSKKVSIRYNLLMKTPDDQMDLDTYYESLKMKDSAFSLFLLSKNK